MLMFLTVPIDIPRKYEWIKDHAYKNLIPG